MFPGALHPGVCHNSQGWPKLVVDFMQCCIMNVNTCVCMHALLQLHNRWCELIELVLFCSFNIINW